MSIKTGARVRRRRRAPAAELTAGSANGAGDVVDVGDLGAPGTAAPLLALPSEDRGADGRFQPGNGAAWKHGRRSRALEQRLHAESLALVAERRAAIHADRGGEAALSTIAIDVVERYIIASALLQWLENDLLAQGVTTSKGKRRALFGAYTAQLDRVVSLAKLIGLERISQPTTFRDAVLNSPRPNGDLSTPPPADAGARSPIQNEP